MAAYTIGGGRSTLANQSYITRHGGHASRILSSARKPGKNRNCGSRVLVRYSADSRSTREIIQFLSICFIDDRLKTKQIK